MYSALKHQGQPLYKLARAGRELPRAPRRVFIRSLDLVRFDGNELVLRVGCSKGTYVRVLAEDIGRRLGCGGSRLRFLRLRGGSRSGLGCRFGLCGLGLGEVQPQQFGGPADVLIRVAQQPGGEAEQQAAINKIRTALGEGVEYRRVEVVGPRVSGELLSYGMLGIISAIGGILIYLWFRFEWQFALGAMIANVHDLVLTLGFMAIMQIDFDDPAGPSMRTCP